ncbi:amidohydrolase [Tardiphaga alba]|uniref:amidohydrolase n=1 Tax=Tardiphaga alba TaxID=340268 RepID=UPI002010DF01|nr:amidohydrolase [Tardiphaga alba]
MSSSSILLTNGRIYRSAWDEAPADSIVVSDGKVIWAGAADAAPGADETIDLKGGVVIPGLTDAHIHLFAIAHARLQVPVTPRDAASVSAVLALLAKRAGDISSDKWVLGAGLDENGLAELRLPTSAEIDAVIPDHPVLIRRFCGHVAVVNSKALALLGIDDDVTDPEGGTFGRSADGALDGCAKESAAELIFRAAPPMDRDELIAALRATIIDSTRMGMVAAVEAAVGFTVGFDDEFAVWNELRKAGAVPMRLGFINQLDPDEAAERGLKPMPDADWQSISLKYFADGIVGARTAAVSEDYADTPSRGFFMRDEAELQRVIGEAHASGWQVAVHCCGDRATDCIIEAYEKAQAAHPRENMRHRIEHYFVPPDGGLARMKALGALVVTQPSFLTRMRRSISGAFGPRSDRCYPGRSVIEAGVTYIASSDAPTGSWSPWDGIGDAVCRASDSGPAIGADEAVSVRDVIHSYTVGSAIAMKQEDWRGTLMPGMAADLIVLDRDPFATNVARLKSTQVLLTMVRGAVVHDAMPQQGTWRSARHSA